ncbi:uncharacterized protein BDR25DRAFT_273776 [Lindgomyces ingoldianus]|uniref:Uncharacterized protein n=1 Tax=Lindgomyces ingoldianus TaxID=673940 RepID=A0ACB6Q9G2_9PLEO|nr:uncharacterized protein BDR25DRAFT_273776 [Lindgomyces ingoldianus]KAF2463002.1 hypothetical protein BDR25DRAFT_273776 [Lindgomyces ingoldianus]
MDGYQQYNDIPQIQLAEDSVLHPWAIEYIGHMGSSRQTVAKTINVFGEEITLDGYAAQGMSTMPMHRWLHGADRSPVAQGLLHAKFNSTRTPQNQYWRQFEQQWPSSEITEFPPREWSPEQTTISDTSHATQNELYSPPLTHQVPYGSQITSPHLGMPYLSSEQLGGGEHAHQHSMVDASISLRDIEYEHVEPETTIEDQEHIEIKPEFDYEQEPVQVSAPAYTKMEVDSESYQSCQDSGLGHSVRDAESVQPAQSDEEASDSDYKPTIRRRSSHSSNNTTRPKGRRCSHNRKASLTSPVSTTNRVSKKTRGPNASLSAVNGASYASGSSARNLNDANPQRPFPCPLAIYGCQSNFVSKNEWKRHVSTQHIKLGFWRCDLCSTTVDAHDPSSVYHNDFNRKDLFTQHLRRMHAAPAHQTSSARNQKEYPVNEDNLGEHQKRCYKSLRSAPPQSACLFCDERIFQGPNGWEERMEHVGRHLEKDRKVGGAPIDISDWKEDIVLKQWLLDEGLIVPDQNGFFKLGDGKPKRNSTRNGDEESDPED